MTPEEFYAQEDPPEGFTPEEWMLRKMFYEGYLKEHPYLAANIARACEQAFKAGMEYERSNED